MNKFLLTGLALVGSLVAPLSAAAETAYYQIESTDELVDGGVYAFGVVNPNWAVPQTLFELNEAKTAGVYTHHKYINDATSLAHWTFHVCEDVTCSNTNNNHVNPVVVRAENDGKYVNLQNGNVATTANNNHYIEIMPMPVANLENTFTCHIVLNNSGKFEKAAGTNNAGAYGYYTTDWKNLIESGNGYSTYYQIYKVIDTATATEEEISRAIGLSFKDRVGAWATAISEDFASSLSIEMPDIELSGTWAQQMSALTNAVAPTLTNQFAAWAAAHPELVVNFQNAAEGNDFDYVYIDGTSVKGKTTSNDATTAWEIIPVEAGGFKIKSTTGNYYIGALPAKSSNVTITDEANAGVYGVVIPTDADYAVGQTWFRAYDALTTALQWHISAHVLKCFDGTGVKSRHYIHMVDGYGAQYAAIQARRDEYVNKITDFSKYSAWLWTGEEIATATASLNAVSFENLENSDEGVAAKEAEVDAAVSPIWTRFLNTPVLVYFDRLQTYTSINNSNVIKGGSVLDTKGVWILQPTTGLNFKLYNPATGLYMAATNNNTSDAYAKSANEANLEWTLVSCNNDYNEYAALSNTTFTTTVSGEGNYTCLHKMNTNGGADDYRMYHNNDGGSAMKLIIDTDQIIAAVKATAAPDFTTHPVAEYTSDFNKCDPTLLAELNNITAEDVTAEKIIATIEGLPAKLTAYNNSIYGVQPGHIMTIKASPAAVSAGIDNTNTSTYDCNQFGYYMFYSTELNGSCPKQRSSDYTEAKALWYYDEEGHLLNYSNGFYIKNHSHAVPAANVSENSDINTFEFITGANEAGTWQLKYAHGSDNNRGVHFHSFTESGDKIMMLNACNNATGHQAHNAIVTAVTELPVAIHADGKGTLCVPVKVLPLNDDSFRTYEAYMTANGELAFRQVTGTDPIAPNTPLIIAREPGDNSTEARVTVVYDRIADVAEASIATLSDDEGENMFIASHIAQATPSKDGYMVYVKSETEESTNTDTAAKPNDVMFVKAGNEIPGGTLAFYAKNTSDEEHPAPNKIALNLVNAHNGTTTITEVNAEAANAGEAIYDLQGRRLSHPVKGINIINGKKTFVK